MHVAALVPAAVSMLAARVAAVTWTAKETESAKETETALAKVTRSRRQTRTARPAPRTGHHHHRILSGPQAFQPMLPRFLSCRSVVRREALIENMWDGDAGRVR